MKSKTPKETRDALLGILVDRAIGMAFVHPRSLTGTSSISEQAQESAEALLEALKEPGGEKHWSRAQLLIDVGGKWWPSAHADYFGLGSEQQEYLQSRLSYSAAEASRALEARRAREHWVWIWSQPKLPRPDDQKGISHTRPDLVVGLAGGGCELIDLKVTTWRGEPLFGDLFPERKTNFANWERPLKALGFAVHDAGYLGVHPDSFETTWWNKNGMERPC